ncbi:lipid phosphate phosphatase 1 [Coprinopsis cinerea AmutBmut pab1-1]|nr:lipid phosphate phosphatase 1 [Coprinopsis cinerea AmutBmut pab1-1]
MYPEYSFPRKTQIVPIWASALMAIFIPLVFFVLAQARRQSVDDLLTTFLGLIKSVVSSSVFQVIIKATIGGLRPHFYDVCKPLVSPGDAPSGIGFNDIIYDPSICTGDSEHIKDALRTMPSGHSAAAWSGLMFLAFYLNAQLKVISGNNPAYWKSVLFLAPILGAFLLSAYLVRDHHHHWSDVIVGSAIGIGTATLAFRQTFASIWDYRYNHILLPRMTSLLHRQPRQTLSHRPPRDLPFTRESGWDYHP